MVLLCVDKSRQPGFKRLLEAGGAKVSGSRPPFKNTHEFTHAFLGKYLDPKYIIIRIGVTLKFSLFSLCFGNRKKGCLRKKKKTGIFNEKEVSTFSKLSKSSV